MIIALIYPHAILGTVALLAGLSALIARKGNKIHKKSGLVFLYTMLTSSALAIFITLIPGHHNPILLSIGIFSMYLVSSGFRATRYKTGKLNLIFDKCLAGFMIATGSLMILLPMILDRSPNVVLTVFGSIGVLFAVRDFHLFRRKDELKKKWLKLHLGKICGSYIAATTAFLVVNQMLPGLLAWLTPTVLGTVYIIYWARKASPAFRIPPL